MYLDLSIKQVAILKFIKEQVKEKGYPPAIRDICDGVGLRSTSTVHSHLNTLEKRGYIKRYSDRPRGITVCDNLHYDDNVQGLNQEIIHLPLVRTARIKHILSKANVERYIPFPANFIKGNNNFVLKATDNSMRNLGILEDDYLIVDKKSYARNNQIVLVMLNEKDFLIRKLIKKEDDLIELRAENNLIETITLKSNEIKIIGVVTGVFRAIK